MRLPDVIRLWRRALKVDYQPIVHIQAVKKNSKRQNKNSLLSAAQETAKYQVKSADILTGFADRDLEVIDVLEKALSGTRQISFGGLFKKLRHDLQLDDAVGAFNLNLTAEDLNYLEELYVPHKIVGAIDHNPPADVMLLDEDPA